MRKGFAAGSSHGGRGEAAAAAAGGGGGAGQHTAASDPAYATCPHSTQVAARGLATHLGGTHPPLPWDVATRPGGPRLWDDLQASKLLLGTAGPANASATAGVVAFMSGLQKRSGSGQFALVESCCGRQPSGLWAVWPRQTPDL